MPKCGAAVDETKRLKNISYPRTFEPLPAGDRQSEGGVAKSARSVAKGGVYSQFVVSCPRIAGSMRGARVSSAHESLHAGESCDGRYAVKNDIKSCSMTGSFAKGCDDA